MLRFLITTRTAPEPIHPKSVSGSEVHDSTFRPL